MTSLILKTIITTTVGFVTTFLIRSALTSLERDLERYNESKKQQSEE